MYTGYFSLSEIPFSIAPNPKFLFMSDRHREALAHLTHGLGDTGGFVLLTGEVGTGKTTISRRLMEQLPENTQSAFILNPTLSSQELLATLCDELKIRYRKTGATLKTLTDKIQEKLLKNHENDINTLLIIDEAQHLQAEALEQLRLLTNLETDTKKLLQVILIGQPELKQLLQRRDLRQLAQRITARYHLMPLSKQEVVQYIKHRLSIAECHRPIFDNAAMSAIHKISQGIPRVINLLCERALANAYGSNNTIVNRQLIKKSAEEALGDEYQYEAWWKNSKVTKTFMILVFASVLAGGFWWGQFSNKLENNNVIIESKTAVIAKTDTTSSNPALNVLDEAVDSVGVMTTDSPRSIKPKTNIKPKEEHAKITEQVTADSEKRISRNKDVSQIKNKAQKISKPAQKQKQKQKPGTDFNVAATEGVSDDLLARFQSAIEETENTENIPVPTENTIVNRQYENTPALVDMPMWVQNGVPNLAFDMHIYASDGEGWVRVNGRDRYEGDTIASDLSLEKILPQKMILRYKNEIFTLPAMATW